jgi:hypothetical protein
MNSLMASPNQIKEQPLSCYRPGGLRGRPICRSNGRPAWPPTWPMVASLLAANFMATVVAYYR